MIINNTCMANIRANDVSVRLEIDSYERQFGALKDQINEEEPFLYSRFSDAVEAGEECMPVARTPGERLDVARRKMEMAKDILGKLRNFPEKRECVSREKFWIPFLWPQQPTSNFVQDHYERAFEMDGIAIPFLSRCLEWKRVGWNYGVDELVNIAKKFCPEK